MIITRKRNQKLSEWENRLLTLESECILEQAKKLYLLRKQELQEEFKIQGLALCVFPEFPAFLSRSKSFAILKK